MTKWPIIIVECIIKQPNIGFDNHFYDSNVQFSFILYKTGTRYQAHRIVGSSKTNFYSTIYITEEDRLI